MYNKKFTQNRILNQLAVDGEILVTGHHVLPNVVEEHKQEFDPVTVSIQLQSVWEMLRKHNNATHTPVLVSFVSMTLR